MSKLKIVLTKMIELDEVDVYLLGTKLGLSNFSIENISHAAASNNEIEELVNFYLEENFNLLDVETEIVNE